MSKNLEMEYREQIQNDVPDLWDRIEAGLEEKKSPKKERKRNYAIGGGILVAGICVAVGLPAFFNNMNSKSSADMSPMFDHAMSADSAVSADSEAPAEIMMNTSGAAVSAGAAEDAVGAVEGAVEVSEAENEVLTITVQVLEKSETSEGTEYQARVVLAENGLPQQGTEIVLLAEDGSHIAELVLQQEYTLQLIEIEEAYYLIQAAEEKN